ncbi:transposase [Nocardioides baekrokdamisoli]|nr:IS3 family transposase [Nocardioides baekrokdamisoli]BBH18129.1 transposase [Nocardioides baekrokdamisoli]
MLTRKHKVSERRACRLVGQNRSSNRYVAVPSDFEVKLVARMTKLAARHPKWGYRMIHLILVEEGWEVNRKRIERLWRQEGLQVPPSRAKDAGQKALGADENSLWKLPPLRRNHIWSYDFVTRRTDDGRAVRVLNVIDEFTRVALGSWVARSIGAMHVQEHLEALFEVHGKPSLIRADNGREFVADSLREWLTEQGVRAVFVAKASPQQNGYIERFNGSMSREVFGHEIYHSVLEVRHVVNEWTEVYNTRRPHRGLGGKTPAAYAKMHPDTEDPEEDGGCP